MEQVHDSYMTHMFPVVYTQSIQLLLQFLVFQILMFLRDSTESTSVWGVVGVLNAILLTQILGGGFKHVFV